MKIFTIQEVPRDWEDKIKMTVKTNVKKNQLNFSRKVIEVVKTIIYAF